MKTIDAQRSVHHAFGLAADRFSTRPFLRVPPASAAAYSDGAVEYSFAQARARVDALAGGYAARGIGSGDRVAAAFDSRVEVYLHLLALNALGASIVPLTSSAADRELAHIIGHSDSRLIVGQDEFRPRLTAIASDLAGCPVIVESDLRHEGDGRPRAVAGLSTEAALLYTSGTTGAPKACMLSNEYFLAIGNWYNALGGTCRVDEHDRLLTPLPPNHMNALCTSFMAMLLCGGCVIQLDRFHPRAWWQTVREEKATIVHCLGVMTAILLTLPENDDEDVSSRLRFCFGPGSDPRHQLAFEKRFRVPLIEAWAMTESGAGGITIASEEPRHVGHRCIGKPAQTTEHRIVDDNERDVKRGEAGELLVRSRGEDSRRRFFSGYYKDSEATEHGWRGGWWHTGDVVREGEDGSLYFVDRSKNVIRRSGENIAAVEVEAALLQHPDVTGCAVCAVPDDIRGDEVFAFVVLRDGITPVDAKAYFEHCAAHLTYFKVPGYFAFVTSLPLTPSQKISRGDVKKLARENLATGDCNDLRHLKKQAGNK